MGILDEIRAKAKNRFKYFIEDYGENPEDAYTLKTRWEKNNLDYVAEDAAQDYHDRHDGWESVWPLTIVILDEELNELGRFSVEREAVPQFHATKEEKHEETPDPGRTDGG
jgi:hypothetical protein